MSLLVILLTAGFFTLLFSQFGHRLPARNSLIWWLVALFLFVAVVTPDWFRPVIRILGIELVSNFVLGGMMLFLFFQMVEQQAENRRFSRQIVELTTSFAARQFPAEGAQRLAGEGHKVLVMLPCFNEAGSLPHLLPRMEALVAQGTDAERFAYCVVDDGSLDDTPRLLATLAPHAHVTHSANVGVAGALLTGFKVARALGADYVVQCDSDGQHPVEEIPRLVARARQSGADLVIGSRFVAAPPTDGAATDALRSTTRLRRTGGMLVTLVLGLFGRAARVSDPTSGFRVYSQRAVRELLRTMPDEYPEPESIALLALRGLRIEEARVEMTPRTQGVSSLSGLKSIRFMVKVTTALLGLRVRSLAGG
ncbi:DUF2304 family protein [Myxococcus sp. K15C18031901]|uniref:DUF2304 family protein n=1 Tax=Myxococcus dinghuensis TaxID=2906761 RepID=UPI0020A77634|nr:DUF2304 family protein [Myxococcus dinghuensis]MCP3098682.1 DUF2304 family protein [Myxococcus dinghuensis]